jgi:hypothetical protein
MAGRVSHLLARADDLSCGAVGDWTYIEEMFWDRGVWQDRSWLFGSPWEIGTWKLVFGAFAGASSTCALCSRRVYLGVRKNNPDFPLVLVEPAKVFNGFLRVFAELCVLARTQWPFVKTAHPCTLACIQTIIRLSKFEVSVMRLIKPSLLLLITLMPLTTPAQNKIFPFKYFTDDLPNGLRVITIPTDYPNIVALYLRGQHRIAQRNRTR